MKNLTYLIPIIFLISCTSEVKDDSVTWADTDIAFHNEMMACSAGTDFTQESVDAMMSEYRSLLNDNNLVLSLIHI